MLHWKSPFAFSQLNKPVLLPYSILYKLIMDKSKPGDMPEKDISLGKYNTISAESSSPQDTGTPFPHTGFSGSLTKEEEDYLDYLLYGHSGSAEEELLENPIENKKGDRQTTDCGKGGQGVPVASTARGLELGDAASAPSRNCVISCQESGNSHVPTTVPQIVTTNDYLEASKSVQPVLLAPEGSPEVPENSGTSGSTSAEGRLSPAGRKSPTMRVRCIRLPSPVVGPEPLETRAQEELESEPSSSSSSSDSAAEEETSPRRKVTRRTSPRKAPAAAKPRLWWHSRRTAKLLSRGIVGVRGDECRYCGLKNNQRRLRVHLKQHFLKNFCPCGYSRTSRDTVVDHQRRRGRVPSHGGSEGHIFEVDKASYPDFVKFMGWKEPPEFGSCQPTLAPGRTSRSASSSDFPEGRSRETSRRQDSPPRKQARASSAPREEAVEGIQCRLKTTRPEPVVDLTSGPSSQSKQAEPVEKVVMATQTTNPPESNQAGDRRLDGLKTIATLRLHASQLEGTAAALRLQADELEDRL
jgi:hypothetical protein